MRNTLQVLEAELNFLQAGGYEAPQWSASLIFEDSATCVRARLAKPRTCQDCVLIDYVPAVHQKAEVPCRHIELTADGETLDSLYRWGTPRELHEAVESWLTKTIRDVKRRHEAAERAQKQPA